MYCNQATLAQSQSLLCFVYHSPKESTVPATVSGNKVDARAWYFKYFVRSGPHRYWYWCPTSVHAQKAEYTACSFFLSLVLKTQPNHWTKRMVNTRLTLSFFLSFLGPKRLYRCFLVCTLTPFCRTECCGNFPHKSANHFSNPQSRTRSKMSKKKIACGAKSYLWFKIKNLHDAYQFFDQSTLEMFTCVFLSVECTKYAQTMQIQFRISLFFRGK